MVAAPDLRSDTGSVTLGQAVRARRRALGLTQEATADLAGVGLRLVHEVEHGKGTVQLANLTRLLNALGLHLEVAAGGSDRVLVQPRAASAASAAPAVPGSR